MQPLYPSIKPFKKHSLKVDDIHELYMEEVGDPNGIPIVCCHGGPGGEVSKNLRRLFDPNFYRIILFDQRGCGRSKPFHCLEANTTHHLISDLEAIREFLNIDRWLVAGGGWGSTLGLLYAQQYPERVKAMLLWSICLLRKRDLGWIYIDGVNRFFPEHWKVFAKLLKDYEPDQVFEVYKLFLTGTDDLTRMAAAKAWSAWEAHCATLHLNNDIVHHYRDPHTALNLALLSSHYFSKQAFIAENQIIENMHKIKDIPAKLVHGRYDMLSPMENAYLLNRHWEFAELRIVREAGHAVVETGIIDALVRASKDMLYELGIDDRRF
jgi:proline iminopeptidase